MIVVSDDDASLDDRALTARWTRAAEAIELLAGTRSLPDVCELLRSSARRIVGADGIAIILRDGEMCRYVAEDAMEPLWAGRSFPAAACVSGWAMQRGETVAIPDVLADSRVPQDAYRTTFVRSMLMAPIGRPRAIAAVGAYWSEEGWPTSNQIALLEALARAASTALENVQLVQSLESLNGELEQRVEERTAELERSQERLRQAQKMEVIGQLTGHLAHDFNNLLSPIMAGLDLVLAGRAPAPAIERSVSIAMQAAESAQALVQRLLVFARRQPLLPTTVHLAELLQEMDGLLRSTAGPCIDFVASAQDDLPAVHADRNQLELAILNLVVNARDAMPSGGRLTVAARLAQGLDAGIAGAEEVVRLTVADTGVGMSEDTLASAVEPFFTTKPVGHGTGLGLSMVHGFVTQLGGRLEISSQPGHGARITLCLPAQRSARDKAAAPEQAESAVIASRGRIMLVDDDVLVRSGTREMALDLGYELVELDDADKALAMIKEGLRPDIVITDHVMPGMTGAEFALRLRADYPDIAVVIISGYEGVDLIAPDIVRLSKPFRQKHLQVSIDAARAQKAHLG